MLTDEVWGMVHPEGAEGFLHDHCVRARARSQGLYVGATSFTACLCFVNRHIHFATVESLMVELAQRFERNKALRHSKGRPHHHFGVELAHWGQVFAEQDLTMQQRGRFSVFDHLFAHSLSSLGTTRPIVLKKP